MNVSAVIDYIYLVLAAMLVIGVLVLILKATGWAYDFITGLLLGSMPKNFTNDQMSWDGIVREFYDGNRGQAHKDWKSRSGWWS